MCFVSYKKLAHRKKSPIDIGLPKVAQTMLDCGGDRKFNQWDGHFKGHRKICKGSSCERPQMAARQLSCWQFWAAIWTTWQYLAPFDGVFLVPALNFDCIDLYTCLKFRLYLQEQQYTFLLFSDSCYLELHHAITFYKPCTFLPIQFVREL